MDKAKTTLLVCSSCRKEYRVEKYDPTKNYLCSECSANLTSQTHVDPEATVRATSDMLAPVEVLEARSDPTKRLGSFLLVRELGRGGVGVVYKAWDDRLGRWVAVKKILPHASTPEDLARFRREGKMAAQLDHPNIAPIYEFGTVQDTHFIVMKFIDGKTLDKSGLKDVQQAVHVVREACRGLGHAHKHGIIHRDIKPQNIMVDRDHRVFVLDFGLAKPMSTKSLTLSETEGYLGTPAYMPPEQARGFLKEIDARSDVYSLGATLWAILAGRYPHTGESGPDIMVKIATEPTPAIRKARKDVPESLEAVLLTAMAREKKERYPTAEEFGKALDAFLSGPPSKPPPRRGLRFALSVAGVLLLGAAIGAWYLWEHAQTTEPSEKPRTESEPAPGLPPTDLTRLHEIRTLTGHADWVRSLAFRPDGEVLASASRDRSIKLWNVSNGTDLATLIGHAGAVWSLVFSPDGKMLASGGEDNKILLWDPIAGKELRILTGHAKNWLGVMAVAFRPDGKVLASGGYDGAIKLWNVSDGTEIQTLFGHRKGVYSIAFNAAGTQLASGSDDMTVRIWDCAEGKESLLLQGHADYVWSVAFRPDGKVLASGGADRQVKLWDLTTGKEIRTLSGHSDAVKQVVFHPSGAHLLSSGDDATIKLWDAATGRELCSLTGHSGAVWCLAQHGAMLASGSADHTIKLWSAKE